ncbi:hypothetical protein [Streptomyces sp. NPDC048644]|uniref:hypothetical protein n=1 Tax=Streptomyces sp. NPDC048644 TaxID=3365582 RepID=UPI003719B9CA
MIEPFHLSETRTSYDTVAVDYAELVPPAFENDLLGRAMLGAFAEFVRAAGGSPVADVGCGPGHVTAHLHALGLAAFGVELSPGRHSTSTCRPPAASPNWRPAPG